MRLSERPILDLVEAFRRSKTLFAAVEIGIFDGKRPDGAGVRHLLDACVSLGLLEWHDNEYVNSPVADEYLRDSSPHSLAPYVRYVNAFLYPRWGELEHAVLDRQAQARPSPFLDKKVHRDFVMGMHATGAQSSTPVVTAFDLTKYSRAVDLGAATGHLGLAAKRVYPHLSVVLFDIPSVIEMIRPLVNNEDVELVAGDFHRSALPVADLFLLGRIIHNARDDVALRLLRRINESIPTNGAVLVAERFTNAQNPPTSLHMQSLNMFLCTGGRERTEEEYVNMLKAAGFTDIRTKVTGEQLDAMIGVKP